MLRTSGCAGTDGPDIGDIAVGRGLMALVGLFCRGQITYLILMDQRLSESICCA